MPGLISTMDCLSLILIALSLSEKGCLTPMLMMCVALLRLCVGFWPDKREGNALGFASAFVFAFIGTHWLPGLHNLYDYFENGGNVIEANIVLVVQMGLAGLFTSVLQLYVYPK